MAQTPESKGTIEDEPIASSEHGVLYRTMGIWRIATLRKDHWWNLQGGILGASGLLGPQIAQKIKSIRASISVLIRLMRDVWDVAPYHFLCWLGFSFVGSMETTVDLYVNTYTLEMVLHPHTRLPVRKHINTDSRPCVTNSSNCLCLKERQIPQL